MSSSIRSTADAQRERVTAAAVRVFAHRGLYATPVADVAAEASVSPAYVFRLFGDKEGLFVAAVRSTYARVADAMTQAGEQSSATDPRDLLAAMTDAYVALIADRDLILMQAHAQAASNAPAVRGAVREGLAAVVAAVSDGSGAGPADVQRFIAYGQLCHLIVQTDLDSVPASWAATLTAGISHPS
ncbi:AcrR family transcriptional regulator [Frigoribacterium sp. PvP120]|uniref:TetR/AcrR family transcriptional regulator n=1 Tax=unclassified Frigoribacterium TaxID=2627005 RepID=UPI001AE73451|nr:TetR/AcrR family transcriptional regulator [Frigoribacterium sp. PvP121]MBP1239862.1 AcrR family transcriptional regulator [Frigoribacterium sp. PvP121]